MSFLAGFLLGFICGCLLGMKAEVSKTKDSIKAGMMEHDGKAYHITPVYEREKGE